MKPYFSTGNIKVGAIPTFSLPSKTTCLGRTKLCTKLCYANKAERAYPGVLPCRRRNFACTKQDDFVGESARLIRKTGKRFFRIHESGDFYSQRYLEKWFAIVQALPDVRFLAFTKSFGLDYTNKPENLTVIWSVFPDTDLASVPKGPRAYAGEFKARRKTLECTGFCESCGMCWDIRKVGADIHFDLH